MAELIQQVGLKAACEWIGNSPQVAMNNYAQITKEAFNSVVEPAENCPEKSSVNSSVKRQENRQLHIPASSGNNSQFENSTSISANVYRAICESMHKKTDSCEKHESVVNGPYWTRNKTYKSIFETYLYQFKFLSDAIRFLIGTSGFDYLVFQVSSYQYNRFQSWF